MHYFLGQLGGDYKAYREMMNKISPKESDDVYFLGGILSGNTTDPKQCLDLLGDIALHEKFHVILGRSEWALALAWLTKENTKEYIFALSQLDDLPDAKAVFEYSKTVPPRQVAALAWYLQSCDVAQCIQIGDRWFYLVAGAPAYCGKGPDDDIAWQEDVVKGEVDLMADYQTEMQSDPLVAPKGVAKAWKKPPIIIAGGEVSVQDFYEEFPALVPKSESGEVPTADYVFAREKFLISCGHSADNKGEDGLVCVPNVVALGIDAAGFFVLHYRKGNNQE